MSRHSPSSLKFLTVSEMEVVARRSPQPNNRCEQNMIFKVVIEKGSRESGRFILNSIIGMVGEPLMTEERPCKGGIRGRGDFMESQ